MDTRANAKSKAMPKFLKIISLLALAFIASCGDSPPDSKSKARAPAIAADTILINANIYTLDWDEPAPDGTPAANAPFKVGEWRADADSIAVLGGEILYVGSKAEAHEYHAEETVIIDVGGATVIPGLIDSHVHIAELGEILERVNLTGVETPAAAVAKLQAESAGIEPGAWLIGQGWDEGAWANNYPNRQLLDAAFPENPVYLRSLHGFAVWVNSAALALAGIDKHTSAPVGGEIVRDAAGEPTGILLNRATTLIATIVPKPTFDQFSAFIKGGLQQMAEDGFVAVHEAGANSLHIEALQILRSRGALPIRFYAMLSARDAIFTEQCAKIGPIIDPEGFFDVRSVKAYYDGALGSRGARLLADYSDQPGHRGVSGDGYGFDSALVDKLISAGFQVALHAIGDAGNREVLDYFAAAQSLKGAAQDPRHRVEHAQVLHPDDFSRFKELGLVASMEPPHAVEDKTWAEQRLGTERIKGAYAWRTFRELGVPLTFNSDLPGSDHSIFYGLHAAVTRRDKQLNPEGGWYPEQAVTIEEAIRAYTSWAAYAAFREQQTGTLKKGNWADLTVMNIDPFKLATTAPEQLLNGEILLTMVNGKIVYNGLAE
ncbi:MAG: amidohydrolase [Gammaproteobacteria bacterium]|nr:amidohydrolase [Gammaproteobacteria bacterium]